MSPADAEGERETSGDLLAGTTDGLRYRAQVDVHEAIASGVGRFGSGKGDLHWTGAGAVPDQHQVRHGAVEITLGFGSKSEHAPRVVDEVVAPRREHVEAIQRQAIPRAFADPAVGDDAERRSIPVQLS